MHKSHWGAFRLLLFVPDGYPTFRADVSILFGKYLPRYGILSDLIAETTVPCLTDLPPWGGGDNLVWYPPSGRLKKHLTMVRFAFKHLIRAKKEKYDGIQVRDAVVPAIIGLWVAWRERIPFFYWMSFPIYESYIERIKTYGRSMGLLNRIGAVVIGYLGRWLLYRFILPRSNHIFVQSHRMLEDIKREGIPERNMTPVPMGVDLDDLVTSHSEPVQDRGLVDRRKIVYLGALARVRRIDFLFEVLARVKRYVPNVSLILAGNADEPADIIWLQQRAKEIGVTEDVIWTGWLPKKEAWRFVRASEVALSPLVPSFLFDSCSPTKVVEYLALGVPTVGNDQPDQSRVIRESGAGICVEYSVEAFASAIVELLQNPKKAAEIGARGPRYIVEHRNYQIIARELAAKYERFRRRPLGSGIIN